jgi:hypothetical protein
MEPAGTTVWPNDVVSDPQELVRASPNSLICFLISPFSPKDQFDAVHDVVKVACGMCAQAYGVPIECRRADTFYESKTIQEDIWDHVAKADILVVDVTGSNPNVMFEYGVAATIRRPYQVILIKSADDETVHPFDFGPLRYLSYRRSPMGDQEFLLRLAASIIQAGTPAPYIPSRAPWIEPGAFCVDFRQGDRRDLVLSPGITHRRLTDAGLEFGSLYVYRNSWFLLSQSNHHALRAKVRFRFTRLMKESESGFLNISLRSQHFLANWGGHGVIVSSDGHVWRTVPEDEAQGKYKDETVGHLEPFDYRSGSFIELCAEIDDSRLALSVGNVQAEFPVKDMPYVYGAGKVRVSTSKCRVLIEQVEFTPLD